MVFLSVALHFLWAHKWVIAYSLLEHGLGKTEVGSAIGLAFAVVRRIMGTKPKPGPTPQGGQG